MDITEEFNEISDELYSNSFSLFGYSDGPFIDPVFILNYAGKHRYATSDSDPG